ncbi:putative thiamine biosynthesis oxidoreductase ThiO isoform X1 [Rhodamnia argentea]|uniref:Thiamine biosynthesis oxidoreductase ThiO isoform X1 n=1 Tax=Rhodamnia argentea TaxID=178133 RepID=A0A8B8QHW5_9MYRT|nr:putative thiamine biosynthesis oxidoreductase ThiO isoform X1 [Rhodamnia argentea]
MELLLLPPKPVVRPPCYAPRRRSRRRTSPLMASLSTRQHSLAERPLRYAVLGAGFAGLSVAWHLLRHSPEELHLRVDIYDESGIGGGASGIAGGLLHPYSPKVKLLWQGAECWKECLKLLKIAERVVHKRNSNPQNVKLEWNLGDSIIRRRGILRPAMDAKHLDTLTNNAQNCLPFCKIESIDKDAAEALVPNMKVPFNSVFHMPEAVNIHPLCYLQALFLACQDLVEEMSTSSFGGKELYMHRKSIDRLCDFEGEYDAVIVCLGAKADLLSELSGRLPLRTCRGVIAHLQLPDNSGETYPDHSPSILADAWLAIQGPQDIFVGSTWEWKSRNYSSDVSAEEASTALGQLLPKASAIYPKIMDWSFVGAKAGIRAMPPLTSLGSLPVLGRIDDLVVGNHSCKYWFFGGLGARGLLYHGLLGKLMAQAVLFNDETLLPVELTSWKR